MFEFEQNIVNKLLHENNDFARLYNKYGELKEHVYNGNHGIESMDDFSLEDMKKQKLRLKDQMATFIEDYRRGHS